jgi:hypothetical protein
MWMLPSDVYPTEAGKVGEIREALRKYWFLQQQFQVRQICSLGGIRQILNLWRFGFGADLE